jgi:sec-independent protein translocase protein TatA
MGSMSVAHWMIVLLIVMLVFGPNRLASLGKGMGEGIRSFKEGLNGDGDHDRAHPTRDIAAVEKEKPARDQTPS